MDKIQFKNKNGLTPNRMSGKKVRNVACGFKEAILPCLTNVVNEQQKELLIQLLVCLTELQFLAYAPHSIISIPFWRVQTWPTVLLFQQLAKKFFTENQLKELVSIHLIGMTLHLCKHSEEVVKMGHSLSSVSMEDVEHGFTSLNKITSNKQIFDTTKRFLTESKIQIHNRKYSRSGTYIPKNIEKWKKEHIWKEKSFIFDADVEAMLKTIASYGYKKGIHWDESRVNENQVIVTFKSPPQIDFNNK